MKIDKINDYTFQFFYKFSTGWSNNIGKCCVRVINKSDCPIVIELGQCINNTVPSIVNSIDLISKEIFVKIRNELSKAGMSLNINTEDGFNLAEKATESTFIHGVIVCLHKYWEINKNCKELNNAIWMLHYPSEILQDGIERYFYIDSMNEKKTENLKPVSIAELIKLSGLEETDIIISKKYLQ